MKKIFQSIGIVVFVFISGSWQPISTANMAHTTSELPEWEDSTLSPNTIPEKASQSHFNRFLAEGIAGQLSLATYEWLDLPFAESAYESWYLGMANGYHLFNLQAQANPQLNLIIFDNQGRIRDRKTIIWGQQGGGLDFINSQVLQVNLYNEENTTNGIDLVNLLIDLNGQFQILEPAQFIHPDRKYREMSSQIISRSYFEKFDAAELEEMANEVLAANGEVFSDPAIQKKFEYTSWYVPGPVDVATELKAIEAYNYSNLQLVLASSNQ